MDLNTALIIFVLVALLVFVAARMIRIRLFSSLILALLVGYLTLITLRPPQTVEGFAEGNCNALLYLLVTGTTLILLVLYIILKVFQDRNNGCYRD